MPQIGLCEDLRCDNERKELYECHCCSNLICFKHLSEHVEITRKNQERFDCLCKELKTISSSLKLIIENKLIIIEREKKLIEQANHLLDEQIYSIVNIENILQEINQAISSNHSEQTILKVESSLSDLTNSFSVSKCINEQNNQNELSLENISSESKSVICLDLTEDTESKYSMCVDHEFIENIPLDQIEDSLQYNNQNNKIAPSTRTFLGQCPLTFDGVYGINKDKHSINFCPKKKKHDKIGLYSHFINKHKLKPIYAQRLIEAIVNKQNSKTTKLFNENEDIINHYYKIECPFRKGIIHLFGYNQKNIVRVPCQCQSISFHQLKYHLKNYHHVSKDLAQKLVQNLKQKQTNNHFISS